MYLEGGYTIFPGTIQGKCLPGVCLGILSVSRAGGSIVSRRVSMKP